MLIALCYFVDLWRFNRPNIIQPCYFIEMSKSVELVTNNLGLNNINFR